MCYDGRRQTLDRKSVHKEELPVALAEQLSRCDCRMIFSVAQACLMRLLTDSMVPRSAAEARASDISGDGRPAHE